MLPEINMAITSIKTGINIVKGFNNLKTEYEIKSATTDLLTSIIDIQNNLLTIQSSYQSLLDSKKKIELELENLKNWETNKINHSLKEVGPSVFVYVVKEPKDSMEQKYWLCANCFNTKNQKSILQKTTPDLEYYVCNACGTEISLPSKEKMLRRENPDTTIFSA